MEPSNAQLHFTRKSLQHNSIHLPVGSAFRTILQQIAQFFISSNEPRIWTTTDCYGTTSWHVYDPVRDVKASLESEDEMRAWLERRYYN